MSSSNSSEVPVPEVRGGVVDHEGRCHPPVQRSSRGILWGLSQLVQSCRSFCHLPCQSLNSIDPGDIFTLSIENSTCHFTTHVWTGHYSSDHRPVVQAAERKQHSISDSQKVTNCPCHGLMIGPGWLSERHTIKCKFSNKNKKNVNSPRKEWVLVKFVYWISVFSK